MIHEDIVDILIEDIKRGVYRLEDELPSLREN